MNLLNQLISGHLFRFRNSNTKRRCQPPRVAVEILEERALLALTISEDFSSQRAFHQNGSANLTNGKLELTDDVQQRGSVWFNQKLNSDPFRATFEFELTQPHGTGWADGFTFAVLNAATNGETALGGLGEGMGYSGLSGFAVEFDTYQNANRLDPVGVHVGIDVNGSVTSITVNNFLPFEIRNTGAVMAVVSVDHGVIGVSLGRPGDSVFVPVLATPLPANAQSALGRVGFTAATGAGSEVVTIDNFRLTSNSPPPDLVPTAVSVAKTSAALGSTISVVTDVKNGGSGVSGTYNVSYYLAKYDDGSLYDSNVPFHLFQQRITTVTKPSIAVNSHLRWTQSITVPSDFPGGSYYLGVIVDESNSITESDEANNQKISSTPITILANTITNTIFREFPNFSAPWSHRDNIDVSLKRVSSFASDGGTLPIQSGIQTWVVIHGRSNASTDFYGTGRYKLAPEVDKYKAGDQVLVLNWSEGASDNSTSFTLEGAAWIPSVAQWAAEILKSIGVTSTKLYLIGHSWGSYVAYETANRIPGLEKGIVALDPAKDEASEYSASGVQFGAVAKESWAFFGGGFYGSPSKTATAKKSFLLDYVSAEDVDADNAHRAPVYLFESLIRENNDKRGAASDRAKWFSLSALESGTSRAWKTDAYYAAFEGVFTIADTNNNDYWGDKWDEVTKCRYKLASTGQEKFL